MGVTGVQTGFLLAGNYYIDVINTHLRNPNATRRTISNAIFYCHIARFVPAATGTARWIGNPIATFISPSRIFLTELEIGRVRRMAVRIVHFGSDTFNRVAALKNLGYQVDECKSLAQLHASLVGIPHTDAVAIAEKDGAVPDHAISLIRAISAAPLVLFRDGNHHYNVTEFDLVVPFDKRADAWLSDLAELIARTVQRNS
jgi:hypothetical protein